MVLDVDQLTFTSSLFHHRVKYKWVLFPCQVFHVYLTAMGSTLVMSIWFVCLISMPLLQVGYTPDYLFLLQTILRTDPQVLYHLGVDCSGSERLR